MSNGRPAGDAVLSVELTMLIVLQVAATVLLWLLRPTGQAQTDTFALFLSVDLMAFAMTSYIFRTKKAGKVPSSGWVAVGCLALMIMLASDLVLR